MHVASGQHDYSGRYCYIWITLLKAVLAINGIDTNQSVKPHSSRTAAMSAFARYLPIQDIVKRAGWSN